MNTLMRGLKKLLRGRTGRLIKNIFWYPFRTMWYKYQIDRATRTGITPVLVYQMGKVASTSVMSTLHRVSGILPIHLHFLSPENIAAQRQVRRRFLDESDTSSFFDVGLYVYTHVIMAGHRTKVISLVREPIGRNVSAYFQNLDEIWGKRDAHRRVPMEELIRGFEADFPQDEPLNWFDREFKSATGVDVYAQPFPHERGYVRMRSGQFDVLVMRFDLDDELKARYIGELLGVDQLNFARENLSEEKAYADTYRQFRKRLDLSQNYVSKMLDSKYARHFYSDAERSAFRKRWLGKQASKSA